MIRSDSRFAWLYGFVVFVLTACATVEPAPELDVTDVQDVSSVETHDVATLVQWPLGTKLDYAYKDRGGALESLSEIVLYTSAEGSLHYDKTTETFEGSEEFLPFFWSAYGLFIVSCDTPEDREILKRSSALGELFPLEIGNAVTVPLWDNVETTFEVVEEGEENIAGKVRKGYWVTQTEIIEGEMTEVFRTFYIPELGQSAIEVDPEFDSIVRLLTYEKGDGSLSILYESIRDEAMAACGLD